MANCEIDDGGPYNVKEYPQREIYAFGRYLKCQILNWDDGQPPPFLICHPLDPTYHQEFLATRGMGAWMHVDLRHALWLIANSKEHSLAVVPTRHPLPGHDETMHGLASLTIRDAVSSQKEPS